MKDETTLKNNYETQKRKIREEKDFIDQHLE
jgi:hypothetical protein